LPTGFLSRHGGCLACLRAKSGANDLDHFVEIDRLGKKCHGAACGRPLFVFFLHHAADDDDGIFFVSSTRCSQSMMRKPSHETPLTSGGT